MLENDLVNAGVAGGFGGVKQRRVPLAEGDDVLVVIEEGEEFAVAPDAALIEERVVQTAFAEGPFERGGVDGIVVYGFEEAVTIGTIIKDVRDGEAARTILVETG